MLHSYRFLRTARFNMKNFIRNALSIRKKRTAPPVGHKPAVGSFIILGDTKMEVTHPLSQDLWSWMVLSGWRNVPVKEDRRQYTMWPKNALVQLMQSAPAERDACHARLLEALKNSAL